MPYSKNKPIKKMRSIGFKKRLKLQKKKSNKYNSFRIARGGIRL
jgi:hypothetical protein